LSGVILVKSIKEKIHMDHQKKSFGRRRGATEIDL